LSPLRPRAQQELRGVQRIALKPGESQRVTFTLEPDRDLRHYDEKAQGYALDAGDYEVRIGASSADIRLAQRLTVHRR
jgi:beta-glucosidase